MFRISVIIPALNEAAGIASAVQRCWATRPHEVLVADGGSSDATAESAQSAGATVLTAPRGRGSQQNTAARAAAGDVLLFLHADCWLDPTGCRQIEQVMQDATVACGAFCQRIEDSGHRFRWLERGNAWRARRLGLPYGDQGLFFRRTFFEQLGGFPETPLMEDWILMRCARRLAWPVLLAGPLHVSARRWQRHGVVRQTLRNWALVTAATLGVSPRRLARYYQTHSDPARDAMSANGLHIDLRCPHCSWAQECNEAELVRRLTGAGLVKRNAQLTSLELRELTRALAGRLACPTCGVLGLHAADSPDPEDLWPTAARCEICGQPIPPERLEIFPNARTCVACQRADDAGQAPRETEYCPQCGALMVLRKTAGSGITRYKLVCTAVPPCRS